MGSHKWVYKKIGQRKLDARIIYSVPICHSTGPALELIQNSLIKCLITDQSQLARRSLLPSFDLSGLKETMFFTGAALTSVIVVFLLSNKVKPNEIKPANTIVMIVFFMIVK